MNLAQPHTGSVFVTLVILSLYELFQILVLAFMWEKKNHKQQYKIFLSPGLFSQLKIFFVVAVVLTMLEVESRVVTMLVHAIWKDDLEQNF